MATTAQNINIFIMKPVEILKKGLAKLWHQIWDWRTRLEGELRAYPHQHSSQKFEPNLTVQMTRASFVVSRHITMPSPFTEWLITMKPVSPPLKSMTLTNSRQCDLLKMHGMKWTLQPSKTAGKRPAFYLTHHHHPLNPPFQSHPSNRCHGQPHCTCWDAC